MKGRTIIITAVVAGILTTAAYSVTTSGPSGQGTIFLPVGNGYVNGCDVERIFVTPAKSAPQPPPGGISYPTPELTWVTLSSGKSVALPEGTDPAFVAAEIAGATCSGDLP